MAIKKPRLTRREIMNQISNRTGATFAMTKIFMNCFDEIVQTALLGQVEVPIGGVGALTWMQIMPRENVTTWDAWNRSYSEPHDVPGFQKTNFKVNRNWATKLKKATLFEMGEENPVPITYDEFLAKNSTDGNIFDDDEDENCDEEVDDDELFVDDDNE